MGERISYMATIFDTERYAALARAAAAEGIVLLKNDGPALPLAKGTKTAVFGRSQFHYYKSGTGSGGLVNTSYVTSILDALLHCGDIQLNDKVMNAYQEWLKENPFDNGSGWASEPWSQKEMPLNEELVKEAARESDTAIIILGRTAGEDKDNSAREGSYLLDEEELRMLKLVCGTFQSSVVLLNTGSIIDMKWVEETDPSAVLYVWQGGQEGGNAVLDVLTGAVNPSGRLSDTIARNIEDYPSTKNFGDADRNIYQEDIYIGYRYFETFAKDKVIYPFGYGLSYTTFAITCKDFAETENGVKLTVAVTNTGTVLGKEVVQVYCEAPQGRLGKPSRVLCGFAKTGLIAPGNSQVLTITCGRYYYSSYDDSGISGLRSCYVLEPGTYTFYAGSDVRSAGKAGSCNVKALAAVEQLRPAMSPTTPFKRLRPMICESGLKESCEEVPLREYDLDARIEELAPPSTPYTGNRGYRLADVQEGKVSLEEFLAQLTQEELCIMLRGEGMCSDKVTPGTAGAFGAVTDSLKEYGIPVGCCADGPSGIRMDCGTMAFSLPNGTCLACSFNEELSMQLFEMTGLELRRNHIDTLLGPGMNLHRNPLNGRNFEYFSEDPYLTGKMAVSQLKGMHKYQVTGTIKHFACNNQEFRRNDTEGVISERALRELYLKGFEIAVREGGAYSIMSTYGPVNGFWTASNFDLLTTILRGEWGYQGIVMTDWWAKGNEEGQPGSRQEFAAMVRSQNDLYMVVADAASNSGQDDLAQALASGRLTLGHLQKSAGNLCRVLMKTPAFLRSLGVETQLDKELKASLSQEDTAVFDMISIVADREADISQAQIKTEKGSYNIYRIAVKERGLYRLELKIRANTASTLAQIPLSVTKDKELLKTISLTGMDRQWQTEIVDLGLVLNPHFYLKLFFGQGGMEIGKCSVRLTKSAEAEIRSHLGEVQS